MAKRNQSLDAMKGFVILLVMIGHIINLNRFYDPYIYPLIEAVQMPAFFMISGYISGMKSPVSNIMDWQQVISKRAVTYLFPFFTWLLLKQWDDLIRGFTNTMIQLDRGLWFLMTLFIINVLFYTTQLLNKKGYQKSKLTGFLGFCVVFLLLSSVFVVQYIMGNPFLSPVLTIKYIPPFLFGYFLSVYKEEIQSIFKREIQTIAFFACLILFFVLCLRQNNFTSPLVILSMSIIKGLLGSYVVFYAFSKSKENLIKSKLAWIGKYTLEIYTVHFHFATKLNSGDLNFGLYSLRGFLFVFATFIIMSITSALLIYMIKQNKVTNLLMFGRNNS